MGNRLTIVVDIEPAIYNLEKVKLWTAGGGFLVKEGNILNAKVGDKIIWEGLGKVWYDISLQDVIGNEVYWLKGKYVTKNTFVNLTMIINKSLPNSY